MAGKRAVAAYLMLIASFVSTFVIEGSVALKDVQITMPRYVRRGHDVQLSCKYDMEGDGLYVVKWYKGQREFYRYLPKEVPPGKVFKLPGVHVDVTLSNDHDVFLTNASVELSGVFKCVVSAETTFQTLAENSTLTVLVIGDDRLPSVELSVPRYEYHPGDDVSVHCRSPPSYPVANITWYINDDTPGHDTVIQTDSMTDNYDDIAEFAVSRLSFNLPVNDTPVYRIKCRATIFTEYDQNSSVTTIRPVLRPYSGPDTLLRSGSPSSFGPNCKYLSLSLPLQCYWLFFLWILWILPPLRINSAQISSLFLIQIY